LCWNLCPSFPTLFDFIDQHGGDAAAMSKAEQDQVVDECYQCKLCYVKCPYVPPHEWQLDFPRLMLRAEAVHHQQRGVDLATQALGRTDLLGKVGTKLSGVVNRATGTPGSLPRRLMERTVGVAAQRVLPPFARKRFSTWFRERAPEAASRARPADARTGARGKVAVFTTCLVEYQDPAIGHDMVKVYERNGIACELPEGISCCGMPWLDGGDVDRFLKDAERNVPVLAAAVRGGCDIVVPQPTCTYVLKREYPAYLPSDESRLVAEHTYDVAEYLMKRHREGKATGEGLDTDFTGTVPSSVALHVPCHLRAQNIGLRSRDLLRLTGAEVTTIDKCSGIDGTWGYRAENYELSRKVAQPLKEAIEAQVGNDPEVAVVGDCHLANGAILQETGRRPQHPIQLFARAYGIAPEEDATR
jgi:glycerol-3-phosphate dehydrogenase subunit C